MDPKVIVNVILIVFSKIAEAMARGDEIAQIPIAELRMDRTVADALAELLAKKKRK